MSEETTASDETTEVIEAMPSDWHKLLPEELRDAPGLRPLKDGSIRTAAEARAALDNFAKLQGNMSESHIKIPSPDAADADKQAARERILSLWPDLREATEGEDTLPPEDAKGYKLPEGGDKLSVDVLEEISQFAIDHKWGQKQFSDYAAKMVANQVGATEQAEQWKKDQSTKLDDKFGAAKAERIARVASALQQSGATAEYVDAVKEGNVDADLLAVVDNLVGKMIDMGDESSQFVQQVNTDARSLTPFEHKEKANEIWAAIQDVPRGSPKAEEMNRKRMEHIKLSMAH